MARRKIGKQSACSSHQGGEKGTLLAPWEPLDGPQGDDAVSAPVGQTQTEAGRVAVQPPGDLLVSIGTIPARGAGRRQRLEGRILRAVARGVAGKHAPGSCPVHAARARCGRLSDDEFKALVDGLMRDGRLIELWVECQGGAVGHRLVLPGQRAAVRGEPVRAQGRADLVRVEYADLDGA